MPDSRRVKLGLVGCGIPVAEPGWKVHFEIPSIAWSRYFPQIAQNPNAELVAVCDVVEERAKRVVEANKAKEYYTDYEEMLDKAEIEAVIITTPHKLHASMAIEAIKEGKHVLVEKPFAVSFDEADKVVKEARRAGIKLMALPVPSFCMEAFVKAKELIHKGVIGKICIIRSRYAHCGPGHAKWFYMPGGGPVFDLGVYAITEMTNLVGSAKRVQAFCGTAIEERYVAGEKVKVDVEDNAVINLDFGDGLLASIETNYCTLPGMDMGTASEIHGTEGSIFLEKWDQTLKVYTEKELYPGLSGWFERTFPTRRLALGSELPSFINCILQDTEPPYTGEHQRHVIEILESVLESAKTGKSVKLMS